MVAHEIVGVSDAWIEKHTGLNSKEIIKTLKFCMMRAGLNISPNFWNSYEMMNDIICIEVLKETNP